MCSYIIKELTFHISLAKKQVNIDRQQHAITLDRQQLVLWQTPKPTFVVPDLVSTLASELKITKKVCTAVIANKNNKIKIPAVSDY